MKVLVVGRGWTGNKVFAELRSRDIDAKLVSHDESLREVNSLFYHWVVNCAGVTGSPNVDACELNPYDTMNGNVTFPVMLHRETVKNHSRFMHWSSGCIYQGDINSVDAAPNFSGSIYSISKGVSDAYLKDKAVVIRIRMPFSSIMEPKNLITKVASYAANGKLYNAGQNSMTDHDEAVRVSVDLLQENVNDGPYNLVNPGSMDMNQIVQLMNLRKVNWYTKEEFIARTSCERSTCVIPANSRMRTLEEAFREAVRKCYS